MANNKDSVCVQKILDEIGFVERAISGIKENDFLCNEILQHAIFMSVLTIGECASRLSEEFRENHHNIEWHKIVAVRNIAAHGYWELDNRQIWEAIVSDVPILKRYLSKIDF